MVVDVVTELTREGALSELLYADDLVLMSEINEGLRNKFLKWKEALWKMNPQYMIWIEKGNSIDTNKFQMQKNEKGILEMQWSRR